MSFQVKVRAGMDTFYFLEPEREFIFDVRGGIRVVSQFLVIVIRGLNAMEEAGFTQSVIKGLRASVKK